MKYDHKFTCQILLLHHNKGRNGLHFGYFEGRKNALYFGFKEQPSYQFSVALRPFFYRAISNEDGREDESIAVSSTGDP
jgi:hypothetical protein